MFTAGTPISQQVAALRPYLSRVIAVINGKGGVGKTTTVVHLGHNLAEQCAAEDPERRILIVELDYQANVGSYFGYKDTERDDQGRGLRDALLNDQPFTILRDVRPNLDIVQAGSLTEHVDPDFLSRVGSKGDRMWLRLGHLIAEVAHQYDYVLIDCPPGGPSLQRLALTAARWVICPLDFSLLSRNGLQKVAEKFDLVGEHLNPDLELLGILLYNFDKERISKSSGEASGLVTRVRRDTLKLLAEQDLLAEAMFTTYIRTGATAILDCQERGLTLMELQRKSGPKWYERLRGAAVGPAVANERASTIVEDFENLTREIYDRIMEAEGGEFLDGQAAAIPVQGAEQAAVQA